MITFVINLHPGIPSMALAEPFLYPLQKQGELHLIFDATGGLQQRIESAAMQVRRALERAAFTKYQVVFLAAIDANAYSPYSDSLSAQMLLIRKQFLANKWLTVTPAEVFIVAVDQVNEDEAIPAIQVSNVYRDSWELDTKGFIRNNDRFFISEEQIKSLDHIWRAKINLDSSTIVNVGFERLPIEVQERVLEAIGEIHHKIKQYLNPANIDFDQYTTARDINYVDKDLIEAIKNEFFKRLENTKNDPSRYNNFLPSETLHSCIAEHLGIFSDDNMETFRLLRFPVQYSHENMLQQYLIKLAILLSLIVEEEDIIKSLGNKNYFVTIDLQEKEIQQLSYNYFEQLHNVEKRFTNRLQNPPPVQLAAKNNDNCACSQSLDKSQPQLLDMSILRYNGDLVRWNDWNKNVKKNLEEYGIQARKKMQNCIDQSNRKKSVEEVYEEKDIEHKVEELKRTKNNLQEQVEHDFISKSYTQNWDEVRGESESEMRQKLFSRPSKNEIVLMVFLAILLIVIPFVDVELVLNQSSFNVYALYYAGVLLFATLLSLLALFLSRRHFKAGIDKILLHVYDRARAARTNIYDEFERQKKYLKSLCELSIVRQNYEKAHNVYDQQSENNLLIDYHRRQLSEHKEMARKVLHIFKANEQSMSSNFNDELPEPKVELPIHENLLYAPASFISPKLKENKNVGVIENTPYEVKSPYTRIVSTINFGRDRIYEKSNII